MHFRVVKQLDDDALATLQQNYTVQYTTHIICTCRSKIKENVPFIIFMTFRDLTWEHDTLMKCKIKCHIKKEAADFMRYFINAITRAVHLLFRQSLKCWSGCIWDLMCCETWFPPGDLELRVVGIHPTHTPHAASHSASTTESSHTCE